MMPLLILMAVVGGVLAGVSRAINGRLSLSGSPMRASLTNHVVGFAFLLAAGLLIGGLTPGRAALAEAPALAWAGGTLGVLFVASGSWLITRIGALATVLLVISGQMISGVALDLARGLAQGPTLKIAGVVLILAGMWLAQRRRHA